MEVLDDINTASLLAGIRNGIGLTKVCEGLNLDVRDVSNYIYENPTYRIELINSGAMGYRQVLSATNDAAARKNIAAWTNLKSMLDSFISKVVTWEQDKPEGELTIQHIIKVMNRHKVMEEGLTALGMSIEFYYEFIEEHPAQAEYLVRQNLA